MVFGLVEILGSPGSQCRIAEMQTVAWETLKLELVIRESPSAQLVLRNLQSA